MDYGVIVFVHTSYAYSADVDENIDLYCNGVVFFHKSRLGINTSIRVLLRFLSKVKLYKGRMGLA